MTSVAWPDLGGPGQHGTPEGPEVKANCFNYKFPEGPTLLLSWETLCLIKRTGRKGIRALLGGGVGGPRWVEFP